MENYDVIIVGAATSGLYFARQMAEKGCSVKLIEKLPQEKTGTRYDIFHIIKNDFERFGLPMPHEGDKEWAFEFCDGYTVSPYGNYPKHVIEPVVGLHMHDYIMLLSAWAQSAGAVIEYGAAFEDFILSNGKIMGIKCLSDGEIKEITAKTVVDCSGADAYVRRCLPDNYGVEKFKLSHNDKFFVTLKYVKFKHEKDYIKSSSGSPFYKSWLAPQADRAGGIIGIGSCQSYEKGETILKDYLNCVPLPEYDIVSTERGTTPYCRCPYSFVADGYIVSGDAANLTKPNNGEGVTSSMVQMQIAAEVLFEAIKSGGYVTREKLWSINTKYNKVQGADFVNTRALLTKVVKAKKSEFEYFFKYFSEKFLQNPEFMPDLKITAADLLKAGGGLLAGIATAKISFGTIGKLISGLSVGSKLKKHYLRFPATPVGFDEWCKKADKLWSKVGKMD